MVEIDGVKVAFQKIKLRCPLCGEIFSITRLLKDRIRKHNFDCRRCYLNNKIFNVKKITDNLNYQSKTELEFIQKCNERNIEIVNGAKIPYTFHDKHATYFVDFYLPQYKMLIEIKDNHIWHKKQVESGKWQAKYDAVQQYCADNNMTYYLLFPTDIDSFFLTLKEIV